MTTNNLVRAVLMAVFGLLGVAPAAGQETITVELLGSNVFDPADITIQNGDTVHWVWVAGFHNVVSGDVVLGSGVPDGEFSSGDPTTTAGTTFDIVFDDAFLAAHPVDGDVYAYYCDPHAAVGMVGTVTVLAAGASCTADSDCDDGNFCNGAETCSSGTCRFGTALVCDDSNDCTVDSCDEALGCQITNDDTAACDDGDGCTADDACVAGVCVGTPTDDCCQADADCDDGDDCTADVCTNGTCSNDAIADCGGSTGTGGGSSPSNPCGAMGLITLSFGLLGLGAFRTCRGWREQA